MHIIDISVFVVYMAAMLMVGFYFLKKNKGLDDYFVGGRNMGSLHIGLSVVATDVGGGFSIGLGGLGFLMGISGSWMLFTGLVGAWLSAVLLIPRIKNMEAANKFLTFPQLFGHYYSARTAFIAGIISAVGYIGFTASQMLAGAKLAAASFVTLDIQTALIIMGFIIVVYTVMGGIKAVIYTDTIQWILLMAGLILVGIPLSYYYIGGMDGILSSLPEEFLRLDNLSWRTFVNWGITIIPIWFVGMTLYQRIYASRSEKEAKRAWFVAGLFEYPTMAFMGVTLGMFARVAAEQGHFAYLGYGDISLMDAEMGLPLLLRTILPVGLMGLMMSAYFSAIMSTADSCLMAASGNVITDLFGKYFRDVKNEKKFLRASQLSTFLIGVLALLLATTMDNVLELMLYSYAFMVSGLLVPLVGAMFFGVRNAAAAISAMIVGGFTTVILSETGFAMPLDLDPNFYGISASLLIFIGIHFLSNARK
ncbi:MAG: sodium:solute symporter family protein [Bacteroidota bacterium]|nr:sodium:solute symporter family protein [Bacteroidota bacterium]